MNRRKAYETVPLYRTADGTIHVSKRAAQDHAEGAAGHALDALLHEADPSRGVHLNYLLVCHMLQNSEKYVAVLAQLHAFLSEEEP